MKLYSDGIRASPEVQESAPKDPVQSATEVRSTAFSRLGKVMKVAPWMLTIGAATVLITGLSSVSLSEILSHDEGLVGLLHEIGIHIDTPTDVIAPTEPVPVPAPTPTEAPQIEKAPAGEVVTTKPEPVAEKLAPEIVRPTEDAYQTARNNLGGVTTPDGTHHGGIASELEGITDPTDEQVAATQQAIATRLGVSPWEVPHETVREALLNGGFSDSGHSYELWENNSSGTVYLVERPTDDLAQIPETHTPEMEISDATREELITGTAVLQDPLISDFAGDNGYEPGSPEYTAWNNIHAFLKDHESVYGTSWQQSTSKLSDYLNLIGVYKE